MKSVIYRERYWSNMKSVVYQLTSHESKSSIWPICLFLPFYLSMNWRSHTKLVACKSNHYSNDDGVKPTKKNQLGPNISLSNHGVMGSNPVLIFIKYGQAISISWKLIVLVFPITLFPLMKKAWRKCFEAFSVFITFVSNFPMNLKKYFIEIVWRIFVSLM